MLGVPLAILTLTLLWRDVRDTPAGRRSAVSAVQVPAAPRGVWAAGILTAMLPLVHAHTFAVIVGMAGCLAVLHGRIRRWLPFFVISIAGGVAQILWITWGSPIRSERVLEWHLGWDHGDQHILWFWFKNTGLVIPILALAIFWRGRGAPVPKRVLLFYLPFLLCFLLPNVVKLAPWIWDNIKVLVYWHIASAPLIALVVVRVWRSGRGGRLVAAGLTIALTLAGSLDIWRVAVRAVELQIFSREGIAFAESVRRQVGPRSLVVHAPTYNHPIFLTGRRSLMGYPGHVWSHGIPYAQREDAIRRIYSGESDANRLLEYHRVDFVVVGPLERAELKVNELYYQRYPKVVESGEFALHQVVSRTH
jgi:hypothetical protein